MYTGKEDGSAAEYRSTRRNGNSLINDGEHFAVSTVEHRYDAFRDDMKKLKVTTTLSGADSVLIDVDTNNPTLASRIVGFYYELRGKDTSNKVEQWGFIQYTDSTLIPLQEPETGTKVELYLQVVYDTGIAGLNKEKVPSTIHIPSEQWDDQPKQEEKKFYAIQRQESSLYASGENMNTRRFSYPNATAGNSLYRVEEKGLTGSDQTTSPHMYQATKWNVKNYHVPQDYIYGKKGAYLETSDENLLDMPVLKGLAESDVALEISTGSTDIKKDENGKVIITVPAVVPNISKKVSTNLGFHSVNLSVVLTKKSVEALLLTNAGQKYKPEIYLELYEKGANENDDKLLDNKGNRYFALVSDEDKRTENTFANQAKEGNEENGWRVEGESNVEAYFLTKAGDTDTERTYHIAIRNLECDTSYVFKMYCYDTTDKKVYIIDNDTTSGRPSGQPLAFSFKTLKYLNVGKSTNPDSLPLKAEYEHKEYGKRNLNVEYTLNSYEDYYLRYQIKTENGNQVDGADTDAMMEYLGYNKKEVKSWWHYDKNGKKWEEVKYPVYVQEDGTVYSPKSGKLEFQLEGRDVLNTAGDYKLEIKAIDLYTDEDISYLQDNDNLQQGTVPTAEFTVPVRSNILVEPKVTYEREASENPDDKAKYNARLTLTVRDNGLRMGVIKGSKLEMGYYRVVLEKAGSAEGSWNRVSLDDSMIVGERDGELFGRGTTYTITYPVVEGERYRLRVRGVDILDLNNSDTEQDLYDSEKDSRMKADLSVTALDKPQLGNPAFDFNIHTGDFTISVQRGSNLDQIKQATITLYNMSGENGQISAYDKVNCSFGSQDNKGWQDMVISLSRILDDWKKNGNLEEKDSLVLTVQYEGDGAYLGENTFAFMYR